MCACVCVCVCARIIQFCVGDDIKYFCFVAESLEQTDLGR